MIWREMKHVLPERWRRRDRAGAVDIRHLGTSKCGIRGRA